MEISPKQRQFYLDSTAKINILQGAVRSGKSYIASWRFINEVVQHPEPNAEFVIITVTNDAFIRNLYVIFRQILGDRFTWSPGKRQMVIDGKKIHVIGASDERAEQKIRGPTFHGAFVDEATIIPESAWRMLVSRCAMGGARIFATTNPDSPFHWLYSDYIKDNPDVKTWHFTFRDNPILKEDEKEYLKRQYKGLWYKRFIEGLWIQAEGSVYDFFEEKYHVLTRVPHYFQYYIVGVDYGIANPTVFTLMGINGSNRPAIFVEKEFYYSSKFTQRQKTDAELVEDLKYFVEGTPVKFIYIDPSALSFITECRRHKLPVRAAKNDVLDGIRFTSSLLSSGDLKVHSDCKNLIKEFHSYIWDEKAMKQGLDKPVKEHDHALDSLRYAVFTHFGHWKSVQDQEKTEFQTYNPNKIGWGHGWERIG